MYIPKRDSRFEYVFEAVEHIEENNCKLGCVYGAEDSVDAENWGGWGAGCQVLIDIVLEKPVEDIDDQGDKLVCTRRRN